MQKLREAAEAAESLSHDGLRLSLFVTSKGIVAKADAGGLECLWLVGWEQLSRAHHNPLLGALSVVAETVKGKANG